MRLIDADALKASFEEKSSEAVCGVELCKAIIFRINKEPTVDAVPVRHGKWIKADSQQYFRKHYPCFTCSVCGYRKDSQKKWNYCPNCGAKMEVEHDR